MRACTAFRHSGSQERNSSTPPHSATYEPSWPLGRLSALTAAGSLVWCLAPCWLVFKTTTRSGAEKTVSRWFS